MKMVVNKKEEKKNVRRTMQLFVIATFAVFLQIKVSQVDVVEDEDEDEDVERMMRTPDKDDKEEEDEEDQDEEEEKRDCSSEEILKTISLTWNQVAEAKVQQQVLPPPLSPWIFDSPPSSSRT